MGHVSKKTMIGTKVFITFVFKTTGVISIRSG